MQHRNNSHRVQMLLGREFHQVGPRVLKTVPGLRTARLLSEAKQSWYLEEKPPRKILQRTAMADHLYLSLALKAPCLNHHKLAVTLQHFTCTYGALKLVWTLWHKHFLSRPSDAFNNCISLQDSTGFLVDLTAAYWYGYLSGLWCHMIFLDLETCL